jgi:hypothetical protein
MSLTSSQIVKLHTFIARTSFAGISTQHKVPSAGRGNFFGASAMMVDQRRFEIN